MKFPLLFCIWLSLIYLAQESLAFTDYDDDKNNCEIKLYNESCDSSCHTCNLDLNLECVQGYCKCLSSANSKERFVHVDDDTGCHPISLKSNDWFCKHNNSCSESALGKNAYCWKPFQSLPSDPGHCTTCKSDDGPNCGGLDEGSASANTNLQLPLTNIRCNRHLDCTNSQLGRFSRCNTTTGFGYGLCECYDTEVKGRDVFLVDNVCYVKKKLDQSCKNDMECNATIIGEAVCLGSEVGTDKTGVCKCADAHEFEPNFRECLKLGTLHSDCKSDFQCQHVNALGPLSKCHEEKKVCDCWDTESHGAKKTAFHEGRCHFSRGANETCTEKIECVLGYHKNADCLPHPSYNGEKVCQCPPGVDCKSAGTTCSASLVPVIAAGLYVSHRYLFF